MEVWSFFFLFVVLIIKSVLVTESAFSSELGPQYDRAFQRKPPETGSPCEFNRTISANATMAISATFDNETMFAVIEVHSFVYNISISYGSNETQSGTNIGFIVFLDLVDYVAFSVYNPHKVSVEILGFITPHSKYDPIPGAFIPTNGTIKPTIELTVLKNLIKLYAQPAIEVCVENETCSANATHYKLFYFYTTEKDYSKETYFEGIRVMADSRRMQEEAYKFKPLLSYEEEVNEIDLLFANYPGTGILFNIIIEAVNGSSKYISAHTFGCDFTTIRESCIYLDETPLKVEVIVMCVAGLILCFCGYEWRSFELYIMVFLLISVGIYTALYNRFILEDNLLISMVSGIIGSTIVVICVSCFKCVLVRHITAFYVFGVLTASSVIFFTDIGNHELLKNNTLYWASFNIIVLLCILLLFVNSTGSHFITTSVVGSFMAVLTVDYFAGTSLKFIFLDNIRRITVKDFCKANSSPPYQTPDLLLTVLWISAAGFCLFYQLYKRHSHFRRITNQFRNNNFPPKETYSSFDETSPLLRPDLGYNIVEL